MWIPPCVQHGAPCDPKHEFAQSLLPGFCWNVFSLQKRWKNRDKGIANPSPGWIQTMDGEGLTSDPGFSWLQVPPWQFQVSHLQLGKLSGLL